MSAVAPPDDIEPRSRALREGARSRRARRLLAAASASAALLIPAAASASDPSGMSALGPAIVEALNEFTLYSQAQFGLAGALGDWAHPGGMSLRTSISFVGFGAAAALRYERISGRHGAALALGGQLRLLGALEMKLYQSIDPFVSLGGEIGGDSDAIRASGYLGAGCDVALFPSHEFHPALVFEYQIRPLRTPSDMPLQLLHLGAAIRSVF